MAAYRWREPILYNIPIDTYICCLMMVLPIRKPGLCWNLVFSVSGAIDLGVTWSTDTWGQTISKPTQSTRIYSFEATVWITWDNIFVSSVVDSHGVGFREYQDTQDTQDTSGSAKVTPWFRSTAPADTSMGLYAIYTTCSSPKMALGNFPIAIGSKAQHAIDNVITQPQSRWPITNGSPLFVHMSSFTLQVHGWKKWQNSFLNVNWNYMKWYRKS